MALIASQRLTSIKREVEELHPTLKWLLPKLPRVIDVEYCHGVNEMGADFVVSRADDAFRTTEYIGVIAKVGKIVQNFVDIERHIDECTVPRFVQNGKTEARLTEIWVIATKNITNGAKRKIYTKYSDRAIKFIDGAKLQQLIDEHTASDRNRLPSDVYERSRKRLSWESKLIPKAQIDNIRYSFTRPQFIHPLLIRKLVGQVSDPYEATTGVDVAITNRSELSFGTFNVSSQGGRSHVSWRGWEQSILRDSVERRSSYSYSHIATSESGIELVECYDCGGGSGVFGSVGFLSWERDSGFNSCINSSDISSERIILKSLGSIPLGDRYGGNITFEGGVLVIGPDEGWYRRGDATVRRIPVP